MSDRFHRISAEKLLKWILEEEKSGKIFGIYKELFFSPAKNDPFKMKRYGKLLETPVGVAAGPHSQLAHNIIASWLCGARYIELKTVQTLDNINVAKPCIDMEDEGYNCEWSQELRIRESFDEYLNAWIIIHILRNKFGWKRYEDGFIFNLSIGYDYEGILNPNVQWFLDRMNDCTEELGEKIEKLGRIYPDIKNITIPGRITDNVTLSTMHGCPPDEIEKICTYLITERKLHTTVKLNPTLLGPEELRSILNQKLGYKIAIPDEAFEHDLKFKDAVRIINTLSRRAEESAVEFSVKLSNTLESLNSTRWLPSGEKMVYTSGRALHPLTVNLARKLQSEFKGELDISFSAGVDAFNITDTLACNLSPVTVCSDLLKPGGYLRLPQYLEELEKNFKVYDAHSIDSFITAKAGGIGNIKQAGLKNLIEYANRVVEDEAYHKSFFPYENIKTRRPLTSYDCIHSPCIESCAVSQDVPGYMYHTANGNFEEAYRIILKDNPLPNMTGNVCDHLCQTKCTRLNYDNPLLIREIKRFISEKFATSVSLPGGKKIRKTAAVIGAGPSGLSCAYFLSKKGLSVEVFESKASAGGMVSGLIPYFRLSDESVENDMNVFEKAGIKFHFKTKIDAGYFVDLRKNFDFVYIGIGAQKSKKLDVPGEELNNIYDQLGFLEKTRRGKKFNLGGNVAVIGAGLSAIDAARTAKRIVGKMGNVTMIYRRTKNEMPADAEEIADLFGENIELMELASPLSFHEVKNKIRIELVKMELKEPDESGRPRPVVIENSGFSMEFDSVITAIGQDIDPGFIDEKDLKSDGPVFETRLPNVYAGGDAIRGADSLINAMSDGKKAAEIIYKKVSGQNDISSNEEELKLSPVEFQKKQAFREYGVKYPVINKKERLSFKHVHPVLDDISAMKEAERCLFCSDLCNTCVGVCPNFANVPFTAEKTEIPIYTAELKDDSIDVKRTGTLKITQANQIFNVADFCNECGNCTTFCPTDGAPYRTKPQFHLTRESFELESFGFYLNNDTISFKEDGRIQSVIELPDSFTYQNDYLTASFDKNNYSVKEIKFKTGTTNTADLKKAAEMIFLIKNLKNMPIFG